MATVVSDVEVVLVSVVLDVEIGLVVIVSIAWVEVLRLLAVSSVSIEVVVSSNLASLDLRAGAEVVGPEMMVCVDTVAVMFVGGAEAVANVDVEEGARTVVVGGQPPRKAQHQSLLAFGQSFAQCSCPSSQS